MSRVVLPYVKPMYATYHWMACSGIVAKQNPTSDIWYYNNTVNWQCSAKYLGESWNFGIGYCGGWCGIMPFIDSKWQETDCGKEELKELIKKLIDEGKYLYFASVDDYFIEGKTMYHQCHYNHDGMIMGYDDEKNKYIIAAYDQQWVFRPFDSDQDSFIEGYTAHLNDENGCLCALKALDERQILDIPYILESLKCYFSSTSQPKYEFENTEENPKIYGVEVYDALQKHLDKLISQDIPYHGADIRIFRFIWEHKRCMFERIKAIENELGFDHSLSSEYEEIVRITDGMRTAYAMYTMGRRQDLPNKLKTVIEEIKNTEIGILNKLVQKIG